ncbi:hypothetical protein TNCV_192451 [Trichonephila clavipes]|nr:hypothetical protein TNCV_192451 [Trichonephila clavipes]
MVSPAGQGHVRRHRLSLHFYDPPAGQGYGVKRDFCDLPIRRNEGHVVNTPLVVKKGSFSGDRRKEKRRGKKDKRVRERERTEGGGGTEERERRRKETERKSGRERVKPALNGEKG